MSKSQKDLNIVTHTTELNPKLLTDVRKSIVVIRDIPVIADADVASLYGVETKRVNEAVRNNPDKFPEDYMFEVSKSGITISDSTLPKCRIFAVCFPESVSLCKSTNSRFKHLTCVNVSIIANVTFSAFLLFKIVASIYNPFSVKTLGSTLLLEETFVVENFDRKTSDSSEDKTNIECIIS